MQLRSNKKIPDSAVLTGRGVLIWMIGFFTIVFAVNGYMVRTALSSFGGVDADNAYKSGLAYEKEVEAADAQDKRRWNVALTLSKPQAGSRDRRLEINARDADGSLLTGLFVKADLSHPADRRQDMHVILHETGPGQYSGTLAPPDGIRDVIIELSKNDERLFRTKTRLIIREEAPNG